MTAETLTPRLIRKDIREYVTADGDYLIARRLDAPEGQWLVTATANDPALTQVAGWVTFNEGGFRGRQWESTIDGQQYPSLIEAMREAVSKARQQADIAAFARAQKETPVTTEIVGTVDLTPNSEGQVGILSLFLDQIVDDIKVTRRMPDREIMRSIIDLAFTAGFNAPRDAEQAKALRERLIGLVR